MTTILIWEAQNNSLKPFFGLFGGGGCPNQKPTIQNSECLTCHSDGWCCYGVRFPDGTYSVMGSGDNVDDANRSIIRKLDNVSINHILKWIEKVEAK